ncbi:MAG: hypothetical protein HOU81_15085 [Hamadaea sp.]|uniref:hypothetical protein n=1 Tax=Hamadaea sp. TaxID=2024425 RepID=UPI001798863E|nr:hypothetical protein [Hamadaea sp.]NUR72138.1 hypothetical protein [Hamadaea sp.]NUT21335.1 hypothetical protein [Hamadaea sp.]
MTDIDSSVRVVRGEMQPWSDLNQPGMPPAGGPVVCRLLSDLLPRAGRTLVVGPHGRDVLDLVADRSDHVTVLLRSVSDATELAAASARWDVVAGALDGLASTSVEPYDAVVAIDGLDRVLGADSPDLSWPERLAQLLKHATVDAALILGLENGFSLTSLLDRRGLDERHGDNEWWPLRDDPQRPGSVTAFTQAAERAGVSGAVAYANFGAHTLIEVRAADAARPGSLLCRLGVRGLQATAQQTPLLAPIGESAEAAALAGQLGAVPQSWLLLRGNPTRLAYAEGAADGVTVAVDRSDSGWILDAAGRPSAPDGLRARVGTRTLPDAPTAEDVLFRLAAAGDVPGIRALAAELGAWVRTRSSSDVLCFDDLVYDGSGFTSGFYGWATTEPATAGEVLAAAWHRWRDRLVGGRRRHPWPPWMAGDELVATLLRMSGDTAATSTVERGREIADAVAAATEPIVDESTVDVRSALAEAEAARHELAELQGHVFGLERTLGFRDKQLKVREQRIREMRVNVQRYEAIRNHRLFKYVRYAAKIRHPKQFARAVVRRLRG